MIEEGQRILLAGKQRKFYVKAGSGTFSSDLGMLDLDQAVGANPGDSLTSHTGVTFTILVPRPTDFFEHSKRSGAPMLPKDIGLVIAYTGMNNRDMVLDAGSGSGIAAIYFGNIAKSVKSYEIRPDFARLAAKNIEEAGLTNVEVISADMLDATGTFDIVHLDMTITPDHISHAYSLLVPGGYLACYTPFLEHVFVVMDTAQGLFSEITCHEAIGREITRSPRGTRPSTRVCHSGFISIARK